MAMNEQDEPQDETLEALFAEARALRPAPSADLMSRLLADAERDRPRPVATRPSARGAWREWIAALGGWPAMGGLVAATVTGVWIGAAPPPELSSLLPSLWGEPVSVTVEADEDPLNWLEG